MSNEFDQDLELLALNKKFAHIHIDPNQEMLNVDDDTVCQAISDLLCLNDETVETALYSLRAVRSYLSKDISEQRIENVLGAGILNVLNLFLKGCRDPDMEYEAAWIVTNLAFGNTEQTNCLLSAGTVSALIKGFYRSESYKIRAQMAWAIANISIDAGFYRPELAEINFIDDLASALLFKLSTINPLLMTQDAQVKTLMPGEDFDTVKGLIWSLASLCRGGFKTSDYWSQYVTAFNAFAAALFLDNSPVWIEACWGLARVLSNNYKNPPFFQHLGSHHALCQRLVDMLRSKSEDQMFPILQATCNLSMGPLTHTLLEADLLNSLWWFCSPDVAHRLRRNALMTISNLASGEPEVVARLVDNENVMRTLLYHLSIPGYEYKEGWVIGEDLRPGSFVDECKVLKEVLFVFVNIMMFAQDDCISTLLDDYKIITPSLVHILHFQSTNTGFTMETVDLLRLIIRRTSKMMMMSEDNYNPYINEMLGEGVMEALSYHFHSNTHPIVQEKINSLRRAIESNGADIQDSTLPGANPRRVVQGKEDGDIRYIEDAMNSMGI